MSVFQIQPSARRLSQYRADVTAIMLIAHDLLLSVVASLGELFRPTVKHGNAVARAIHAKCTVLGESEPEAMFD